MVGKIAEIQDDKQKLFLTIDMFGHAITAELGFDQVKKMED
jgi:transcription termination/antitermination protein NusG